MDAHDLDLRSRRLDELREGGWISAEAAALAGEELAWCRAIGSESPQARERLMAVDQLLALELGAPDFVRLLRPDTEQTQATAFDADRPPPLPRRPAPSASPRTSSATRGAT